MAQHRCYGKALADGEAHAQAHRLWSRRDFLATMGLLGAGGCLLGGLPVRAFWPSPLVAHPTWNDNDRILVLIRLDGGNDGLNTVIERGNHHYYNLRPSLAIAESEMWHLNPAYGMPLETNSLQPLWAEGKMKVIFNVGYPDPNLSHFRSSDIIYSASDADEVVETGWIGRFLDNEYAAFLETPSAVPPALQIGVQSNLLFKAEDANMALVVSSPQEFYQIAQTGQLYPTTGLTNSMRDRELGFVRQTANAAFRYAETIRKAFYAGKNDVDYPPPSANLLSAPLSIIARVLKGNMGTRIFLVDIADFDTHVNQRANHLNLLWQLATAVRAFYDDLTQAKTGLDARVLTMTFSEFGRTIYENGSRGTDHGAGTHTLLFGGGIGSGFLGQYQDLSNPDPIHDPPHSVDFRDVYATVLQHWLGNPAELVNYVLRRQSQPLQGLVPPATPALGDNGRAALLGHNPHPNRPDAYTIKFAITQGSAVRLQVLDAAGHALRTLVNEFKPAGSYSVTFAPAEWYLPPGRYRYRLMANGQVFERLLTIP